MHVELGWAHGGQVCLHASTDDLTPAHREKCTHWGEKLTNTEAGIMSLPKGAACQAISYLFATG